MKRRSYVSTAEFATSGTVIQSHNNHFWLAILDRNTEELFNYNLLGACGESRKEGNQVNKCDKRQRDNKFKIPVEEIIRSIGIVHIQWTTLSPPTVSPPDTRIVLPGTSPIGATPSAQLAPAARSTHNARHAPAAQHAPVAPRMSSIWQRRTSMKRKATKEKGEREERRGNCRDQCFFYSSPPSTFLTSNLLLLHRLSRRWISPKISRPPICRIVDVPPRSDQGANDDGSESAEDRDKIKEDDIINCAWNDENEEAQDDNKSNEKEKASSLACATKTWPALDVRQFISAQVKWLKWPWGLLFVPIGHSSRATVTTTSTSTWDTISRAISVTSPLLPSKYCMSRKVNSKVCDGYL
ncbi:hypothetical protein BDD12DRAFT_925382 [Trichophaea hybrida]|nr:hypothetical protein BDD12DRAFT_925382 [Trichophaea hybrida]